MKTQNTEPQQQQQIKQLKSQIGPLWEKLKTTNPSKQKKIIKEIDRSLAPVSSRLKYLLLFGGLVQGIELGILLWQQYKLQYLEAIKQEHQKSANRLIELEQLLKKQDDELSRLGVERDKLESKIKDLTKEWEVKEQQYQQAQEQAQQQQQQQQQEQEQYQEQQQEQLAQIQKQLEQTQNQLKTNKDDSQQMITKLSHTIQELNELDVKKSKEYQVLQKELTQQHDEKIRQIIQENTQQVLELQNKIKQITHDHQQTIELLMKEQAQKTKQKDEEEREKQEGPTHRQIQILEKDLTEQKDLNKTLQINYDRIKEQFNRITKRLNESTLSAKDTTLRNDMDLFTKKFKILFERQPKIAIMKYNGASLYPIIEKLKKGDNNRDDDDDDDEQDTDEEEAETETETETNDEKEEKDINNNNVAKLKHIANYLPWNVTELIQYMTLLHNYDMNEIKNYQPLFDTLTNPSISEETKKQTYLEATKSGLMAKFNTLYTITDNTLLKESEKFNNLYEDFLSAVRIYTRLNFYNENNEWEQIVQLNTEQEILSYLATLETENNSNNNINNNNNNNNKSESKIITLLTVNDIYSISKASTNLGVFLGKELSKSTATPSLPSSLPSSLSSSLPSCSSWINKPLKGVFDQLASGYNIFLFGYGFSGSGKTYTLFGTYDLQTPGLVQLGIEQLLRQNFTVKPYCAFDIYGQIKFKSQFQNLTTSRIIQYYPSPGLLTSLFPADMILDNTTEIATLMPTYKSFHTLNEINKFLKDLNHLRSKPFVNSVFGSTQCIKVTINNKESSRGHLFVVFEIEHPQSKQKNYFISVDMAGIEDPFKITDASYRVRNKDGTINKTVTSKLFSELDKNNITKSKSGFLELPFLLSQATEPNKPLYVEKYDLGNYQLQSKTPNQVYYPPYTIKTDPQQKNEAIVTDSKNNLVPSNKTEVVIRPFKVLSETKLREYFKSADVKLAQEQLTEKNVIDTILEGAFINETINHLKWFLLKKRNRNSELKYQACSPQKKGGEKISDTDVCDYSQTYDPALYFYNPETTKDKTLILRAIEKLERLGNHHRPPKFIMMSVLNVNRMYEQTIYSSTSSSSSSSSPSFSYECSEIKTCQRIGKAKQIKFGLETLQFVDQLLNVKNK